MKTYYLSLCRGLSGYYVKFIASDEEVVRRHAVKYFGKIWCTIYTEAYFYEVIKKRYPTTSKVVNRNDAVVLSDDTGDWE